MTGDLQALHVEPDDTVLVRCKGILSRDSVTHITHEVKQVYPDNKVVVVDDAITVDAVRDLVLVKVSGALIERLGDWSPPCNMRLVESDDGTYEMETRIDYRAENALKEIRDCPLEEGAYQMREIASKVLEEIERPLVEVPA